MRILCVQLVLLTVAVAFAAPQSELTSKCGGSTVEDFSPSLGPKARAFFASLLVAVKADDRHKVATMIQYPLRVNANKGHRLVRNGSEFVGDYKRLFTPAIVNAIEKQLPECLFANWQGVMIGHGVVWFEEQPNGIMKIKTLNIPVSN